MRLTLIILSLILSVASMRGQTDKSVAAPTPADSTTNQSIIHYAKHTISTLSWPRVTTSVVVSFGSRTLVDYALKKYVHEWRPDYSEDNSFPSRHTSWAFGLAGTATYYLVPHSPWWGTAAHTAANAMAFQRVMAKCHYPGDVMAGALIGIGSDLLGNAVASWIFGPGNQFANWRQNPAPLTGSLSESTSASFPLQENFGSYRLGTALMSTIRAAVPVHNKFGAAASVSLQSAPIKNTGIYDQPLTSLALAAGGSWQSRFGESPFAITASVEGGYRLYFKPKGIDVGHGTGLLLCNLQASMMLTRKFAIGAECGYQLSTLRIGACRRTLNQISVGFLSRSYF